MERWKKRWAADDWHCFLAQAESATDLAALRRFTHTGRPLGGSEFVAGLETSMLPARREKEAARTKPPPTCASSASLQLHSPPTKWGSSRLSPFFPRFFRPI
jgi:hypothetical protein